MEKLTQSDLYTLEAYARERDSFRERVLAHKRARVVHVGAHVTLVFEDRLTIQYQVQEILRVERVFEAPGIAEELEAYNPLIPDGSNLKATMLIAYPDADERARRLIELHDIENRVALHIDGSPVVIAIADEDLERSTDQKTSAVHFLRFELDAAQIEAFKHSHDVAIGIDHPAYHERTPLDASTRAALLRDFD
jgi:hypothetical protein